MEAHGKDPSLPCAGGKALGKGHLFRVSPWAHGKG